MSNLLLASIVLYREGTARSTSATLTRLGNETRNENSNDLLRVCSPGGTDLSIRTIDHLRAVEDELSNRLSPSSLTAHQPRCSKRC